MRPGRLYYAMGEAGAGKGSLLDWVREIGPSCGVICAHRYVACPAGEIARHHLVLSDAEFELRERRGLFALTWQARGLRHGLGKEIEHWLSKGIDVLVNGSRVALPLARAHFRDVVPVLIAARSEGVEPSLVTSSNGVPASSRPEPDLPENTLTVVNGVSLPEAGAALLSAIRCAG